MTEETTGGAVDPANYMRSQALARIKARRDFQAHAFTYVLVNMGLVVIWAITGTGNLFWPIFPILGWGVALAANAWAVFWREPISEEEIDKEEARLRERGVAELHRSRIPG